MGYIKMKERRISSKVKVLLLSLYFLFILSAFEGMALAFLISRGEERKPFLVDIGLKQEILAMQQTWGDEFIVSNLDPLLGYARNPDINFLDDEIFVGYEKIGLGDIRIMIMGGSTTSSFTPIAIDPEVGSVKETYSWPRELSEILGPKNVTIFNGAVAGYSSEIQFLKIVRDIEKIKPHIVIFLDGVNEPLGFHMDKQYNFLGRYQKNIFQNLVNNERPSLLPNIHKVFTIITGKRGVTGITFGPKYNLKFAAERWVAAVKNAQAIVNLNGGNFFVFLQPILGSEGKATSDEERKLLLARSNNYLKTVGEFYRSARENCSTLPYCIDISRLFDGNHHVYLDARHQNREGVKIIASRIASSLGQFSSTRGFLLE